MLEVEDLRHCNAEKRVATEYIFFVVHQTRMKKNRDTPLNRFPCINSNENQISIVDEIIKLNPTQTPRKD